MEGRVKQYMKSDLIRTYTVFGSRQSGNALPGRSKKCSSRRWLMHGDREFILINVYCFEKKTQDRFLDCQDYEFGGVFNCLCLTTERVLYSHGACLPSPALIIGTKLERDFRKAITYTLLIYTLFFLILLAPSCTIYIYIYICMAWLQFNYYSILGST